MRKVGLGLINRIYKLGMDVDISQYRASIGSFNVKYKVPKYKRKPFIKPNLQYFSYNRSYNMKNFMIVMSFILLISLGIISSSFCPSLLTRKIKTNRIYVSKPIPSYSSSRCLSACFGTYQIFSWTRSIWFRSYILKCP